jgi:TolB-like protein
LGEEQETTSEGGGVIERLLERHVIQTAAIYVAVAWGAVEILLTLTETLGWPKWINAVALAVFIAGFPVVIILSWYRDVKSRTARSLLVVFAIAMGTVAFWLVSTSSGPRLPARSTSSVPYRTQTVATVAVLPFENLTGDESQQYIANGFTDDIISRLSKHPDLAVVQNESANSPLLASLIPLAQAARLRADYFVTGGLKKEGEYYEISAHLTDLDGKVLWSESFRDPLSTHKLLSAQKRISGEVSRIAGTSLSAPAYCGETANLAAMELYYRGRSRILMRQRENIEAGIELLKKSVDQDPYYGRAWNLLGEGYLTLPAWVNDPTESRRIQATHHPMAMSAFQRALQICSTLGVAYKITVPSYEGVANEWIDQEMQFLHALAMDPNDVSLLRWYAMHLMQTGRITAAVDVTRRAYRIDPLAAAIVIEYARVLQQADRCAEAIPLSAEGRELGGSPMRFVELNCAQDSGTLLEVLDYQEALTGRNLMQIVSIDMSNEDAAAASFDDNHPARAAIREGVKAAWAADPSPRNSAINLIVGLAIQVDEFDFAFEVLNSLIRGNQIAGFNLGHSGLWGPKPANQRFRTDPRFVGLMARIGIADYWREFGSPDHCRSEDASFICS